MTTLSDTGRPTLVQSLLSGQTVKTGALAALVGSAFGIGIVVERERREDTPSPTLGALEAADARTERHEAVQHELRLRFFSDLKGQPAAKAKPTVSAKEASAAAEASPAASSSSSNASEKAENPTSSTEDKPAAATADARDPSVAAEARAPVDDADEAMPAGDAEDAAAPAEEADEQLVAFEETRDDDDGAKPAPQEVSAAVRAALGKLMPETAVNDETDAVDPTDAVAKHATAVDDDKAQAAPAPVAASRFAIQVGSVRDRAAALRLAADLQRAGHAAALVEASVDGAPLYRVRISGFASREAAEAHRETLPAVAKGAYVLAED